jgi:choline transport protein
MTIAVGVFSIAFNSFGAKHLPLFEGIMLVGFVVGFFAICIPLWVLAPKSPASEVFGKFENFGGWASIGAACIVGQSAASAAFIVSLNDTASTTACTDYSGRVSTAPSTWPKKLRTPP